MIRKSAIALLILIFSSCNDSDSNDKIELNCAAVLCASGFNDIYVNFLGETSEENLLDNEDIDSTTIEIVDEENEEVQFTLEERTDSGIFLVIPVSIETYGQKSFTINFEGGNPFTIDFNTTFQAKEGCCGPYTLVEEVDISVYPHELIEPGHLPLHITLHIPES